jgi:hypothetical protein
VRINVEGTVAERHLRLRLDLGLIVLRFGLSCRRS